MNEELVSPRTDDKKIRELSLTSRIETNIPILVRKKVSQMLKTASESLPSDLYLQIDGGYRSPAVQQFLWKNRIKQLGMDKAKMLVADPSKGIPGHSTGGAVDVSLLNSKFEEINLSEPFEKYYDEQRLHSKKITRRAQHLRILLHKAMVTAGFAPLDNEYWHFSYGDERWAKYYNKKVIYKQISNPERYYYPLIQRYSYKIWRRIYKITNRILKLKTNY